MSNQKKVGYDLYVKIKNLIEGPAATLKPKDEFWINAYNRDGDSIYDEGISFCYDCCEKEVERLKKENPQNAECYRIDGGWGIEGESIPYCDTCGAILFNNLLTTFCEEELRHFNDYVFDITSPDDCYSMFQMLEWWEDKDVGEGIRALAKKIVEAKQ